MPEMLNKSAEQLRRGVLIVNADDWGRDRNTTDRILDCVKLGSVSSTSAMVFMEDSQRAGLLAREHQVDTGLHLNFTTPFSGQLNSTHLLNHQNRIARYLLRNRLAQIIYHPGLVSSFEYVVAAQIDEYERVYGTSPERVDGHHHMHLCANVIFGKLLPEGVVARRNFTFSRGEKGRLNRFYRAYIDRQVAKRNPLVDYLFSIVPVDDLKRLRKIFVLANSAVVELETHPVLPIEYEFLTSGSIFSGLNGVEIASGFIGPLTSARERRRNHQVPFIEK